MIKGYVKRAIAADVNPQLNALAGDIRTLRLELDGQKPVNGSIFDFLNSYSYAGIKERVKSLEQKVDLLLKHLNLCKTDVPAKTVLKKCKETK